MCVCVCVVVCTCVYGYFSIYSVCVCALSCTFTLHSFLCVCGRAQMSGRRQQARIHAAERHIHLNRKSISQLFSHTEKELRARKISFTPFIAPSRPTRLGSAQPGLKIKDVNMVKVLKGSGRATEMMAVCVRCTTCN